MKSSSQIKKGNRRMYLIALLIVTLGLALYFILKPVDNKNVIFQQTEALDIPFTKQGELLFISQSTSDTLAIIDIELADDEQKRARGLMYRNSMPEDAGMLFIHDSEQIQGFWMKNTYIPLDIIFVDSNKNIITIHPNTTPLKEWNYASVAPALYVVEVNAGFCNRNNIHTGDRIEFEILK